MHWLIPVLIICILLLWLVIRLLPTLSSDNEYFGSHSQNFGVLVHPAINLRYISNLVTDNESNHLINVALNGLTRSKVISDTTSTYDDNRTSYSYYLDKHMDDPVVVAITERIAHMIGKDKNTIEALQVVRYLPGQEFKQHYDWFQENYRTKINNQRQYTFFIYLNDTGGEGGETDFPKLGLKFKPKANDGLFWENCINMTTCHDASLHQGLAPISGVKYGINVWVNFNPVR